MAERDKLSKLYAETIAHTHARQTGLTLASWNVEHCAVEAVGCCIDCEWVRGIVALFVALLDQIAAALGWNTDAQRTV